MLNYKQGGGGVLGLKGKVDVDGDGGLLWLPGWLNFQPWVNPPSHWWRKNKGEKKKSAFYNEFFINFKSVFY